MNLGINAAVGKYILLLNNDAFLEPGYIEKAVEIMERDPRVGMAGGRIYRYNDGKTDKIDQNGNFLTKHMSVTWKDDGNIEEYVLGPNGSCGVFRREMLDDIMLPNGQYFDDRYFAYWEDIDHYLRAQTRGWKALYCPEMTGYHVRGGSMNGKSRLIEKPIHFQKLALRKRILTIIKSLPLKIIARLLPYLIITEIASWFYFLFRSPKTLSIMPAVYKEVLSLLSETIKKRRYIQSRRIIAAKEFKKFFIKL